MNAELGETITKEFVSMHTVIAGAAAHINIGGHAVTFLQSAIFRAYFGNDS